PFDGIGVPSAEFPVSVQFGCLNSDAVADLAFAFTGGQSLSGSMGVSLFQNGTFGASSAFPLSGMMETVAPDALDIGLGNALSGDADLDLGVATSAGIEIFENSNGSGQFSALN